MQKQRLRSFLAVASLIVVTSLLMLAQAGDLPGMVPKKPMPPPAAGLLRLDGRLVQEQIFTGGDGRFELAFTMDATAMTAGMLETSQAVDVVVVLDRSGSMQGQKLEDGRRALLDLLDRLSEQDRLGLVTYSNDADIICDLLPMNAGNRRRAEIALRSVAAGGGTNLGDGLAAGLALFSRAGGMRNPNGRLILVSDGLANQGVVDPGQLGAMAAGAVREEFSVSTVGVGSDFNEQLMTRLADQGGGSYHYLEDPARFAAVLLEEFQTVRRLAATGLEVEVALPDGVRLVEAAGYPIEQRGRLAVFRPGDLEAGRKRSLFLGFQVDPGQERRYELGEITVRYRQQGSRAEVSFDRRLAVNCVADRAVALSSIDKDDWEKKVLQEDYSRLRDEVAGDIREGRQEEAMARLDSYRAEKEEVNRVVGSSAVQENLEAGLDALRSQITETFAGAPAEVAAKQKASAKDLQYQAYEQRRK